MLVDVEAHGEVDVHGALSCVDAALECAHVGDGALVECIFAGAISTDALLVIGVLWQDAEL